MFYLFLNNKSLQNLVPYFIVKTQYIIHKTYHMCVNLLVYAIGKTSVNSSLLVVKFSGTQSLFVAFQLHGGLVPLTITLFKGQLYNVTYKVIFAVKFSETHFIFF